jgi:hypothetical protein
VLEVVTAIGTVLNIRVQRSQRAIWSRLSAPINHTKWVRGKRSTRALSVSAVKRVPSAASVARALMRFECAMRSAAAIRSAAAEMEGLNDQQRKELAKSVDELMRELQATNPKIRSREIIEVAKLASEKLKKPKTDSATRASAAHSEESGQWVTVSIGLGADGKAGVVQFREWRGGGR